MTKISKTLNTIGPAVNNTLKAFHGKLSCILSDIMKTTERIAHHLVKYIHRPRFWTKAEWEILNPKEKLWIYYKHIWFLKNSGSAEVDIFTNPLKEVIFYGGIILANIQIYMLLYNIQIDMIVVSFLIVIMGFCLYITNFYLQFRVGNWKDDKDFIALESEIPNKRVIAFREIRKRLL